MRECPWSLDVESKTVLDHADPGKATDPSTVPILTGQTLNEFINEHTQHEEWPMRPASVPLKR
jgi:hypothetical protein